MDDRMKEAALQAALQAANEQAPQESHIQPEVTAQQWSVGVVPAMKKDGETGKVSQAALVHAICYSPLGQFHFLMEAELAGQVGELFQNMAVQAKAAESGLIVPESSGIFKADGS